MKLTPETCGKRPAPLSIWLTPFSRAASSASPLTASFTM